VTDRLAKIEQLYAQGRVEQITQEDQQWLVDFMRDNQVPCPAWVAEQGRVLGLNVNGLLIDGVLEDPEDAQDTEE
jgi:hypothetical protein